MMHGRRLAPQVAQRIELGHLPALPLVELLEDDQARPLPEGELSHRLVDRAHHLRGIRAGGEPQMAVSRRHRQATEQHPESQKPRPDGPGDPGRPPGQIARRLGGIHREEAQARHGRRGAGIVADKKRPTPALVLHGGFKTADQPPIHAKIMNATEHALPIGRFDAVDRVVEGPGIAGRILCHGEASAPAMTGRFRRMRSPAGAYARNPSRGNDQGEPLRRDAGTTWFASGK